MAKQQFSVAFPLRLKARLRGYCNRHLIPISRLLRRLLLKLDWWDDAVEIVAIHLPKSSLRDPKKLEEALDEAYQQIREHYSK